MSHADALKRNPCEDCGETHASVVIDGEALCGACAKKAQEDGNG